MFSRSPGAKIGADPSLTGAITWLEWKQQLEKFNLTLISRIKNPIDEVWLDQPSRSKDPLEIHDLKFAGKNLKEVSSPCQVIYRNIVKIDILQHIIDLNSYSATYPYLLTEFFIFCF